MINCGLTELEDVFYEVVFPNLSYLDISGNKITTINDITERPLDVFVADNNKISTLNISQIRTISCLSLNNNELTDIKSIKKLICLRILKLKDNFIEKEEDIDKAFRQMRMISSLDLTGNPLCQGLGYKMSICKGLPSDRLENILAGDEFKLDGKQINEEDVRGALRFAVYDDNVEDNTTTEENTNENVTKDGVEYNKNTTIIDYRLTYLFQSSSYQAAGKKEDGNTNILEKLLSLDDNSRSNRLTLSFDGSLETYAPKEDERLKSEDRTREHKRIDMEKHSHRMKTLEYVQNEINIVTHPKQYDARDVSNANRFLRKVKKQLEKLDSMDVADSDALKTIQSTKMIKDGLGEGDRMKAKNVFYFDVDDMTEIPFQTFIDMLVKFDNDPLVEVVMNSSKKSFEWNVLIPFELPYGFILLTEIIKNYTKDNKVKLSTDLDIDYDKMLRDQSKLFNYFKDDTILHFVRNDTANHYKATINKWCFSEILQNRKALLPDFTMNEKILKNNNDRKTSKFLTSNKRK